ncbi:MAG: 3-hexulose-6-phosphate synthase [Thermoplasmatota archaeon]
MKPVLQVALDFLNSHRAMQIAKETIDGGADWLEAGTPLIKSEGIEIVRILRETFPQQTIVADLKTMDTGALETEMAAKAGADIVCVMAASDDSTIKEAVASAHKYGTKIMVDLLGVKNKIKRSQQLEKMGVHYLCLHIGIDEQMKGKKPVDYLQTLIQNTTLPVAVAGGITADTASTIVETGAAIVIVGGAITKAKNVTKATKTIIDAIQGKTIEKNDYHLRYHQKDLHLAFSKVSTPNISDAMHRKGAMKHILPLKPGYHMVGKALTVETIDGDWAKPVEAIDQAEPGTVLVINAHGGQTAIWGELATRSAKQKGLAGIVVDGAVRDIDDICTQDLPVFCRFTAPNAGDPKGFGEIGAEIICGEQNVQSGDWIIGDDSGVVVVPQGKAQEIANRALDVKEQENRIREEINQGQGLGTVLDLKKWEKKNK